MSGDESPPRADPSDAGDSEASTARHRVSPPLRVSLGIIVGGVGVWVVVSTAGGLGDAVDAVRNMRGGFIALACAAVTARFVLYSVQVGWLSRRSGPLDLLAATALALVFYGFGAVTPAAPVEGLAIANRELRRRGRSTREARLTMGFAQWFAERTFYAVAALDLIVVVALGHLTWNDSWPLVIVATVVIFALVSTAMLAHRSGTAERLAVVLGAIRFRRRVAPRDERRERGRAWHTEAMAVVGPPWNRVRLACVSAGAVLADGLTLWATCHAAGFHIHPELAVLAATVGTMASWVPLLPGGLGLVEVAIPAILHRFGAPLDGALAATIVYRAVGTLAPALAGAVSIAALRSGRTSTLVTAQ